MELGSSPIAPMCRNIMIGSTRPGPDLFSFFPVCRSARMERKNQVVCGNVRICTYLYLFSDQSASFFDLTRSSSTVPPFLFIPNNYSFTWCVLFSLYETRLDRFI